MVEGGKTYKESGSSATNTNPKESDNSKRADQSRRIRFKAITSNNVWEKRYIRRKTKGDPPSKYKVGETVLIRYPFSRKSRVAPRKRFALEGKILKRNLPTGKYKITFESPKTQQPCTQWVSVEDITSLTSRKEKRKRAAARRHLTHSNQDKQKAIKKSDHRKKFRIVMTRQERYQPFLDQGYEVSFNPAGDGNCQFAALSWFLRHLGILRSEETLRKEIVDYLNNNPLAQDGFPLELFVGVPWSQYLENMTHNGAYGDHITLQATANVYNVELVAQTIIHYVCLRVPENTVQSKVNCVEKDSDNILKQHDFNPNDNNILESHAYKNGVISKDHTVEKISGNQEGQEEMVVSDSNKTDDENVVDDSIHKANNRIRGNADQNGNANERDEISEDHVDEDIRAGNLIVPDGNMDGDGICFIESLPIEVLSFTVDFALTGSPRIIVDTYNSLCALNTHFRRLVTQHIQRLPKISYDRDIYIGYHSTRGICRKRGRGSGLVSALKSIIDSPQWINAWVWLLCTGTGSWFYVRAKRNENKY